MAERFNAPVLKTGVRKDSWVRIPPPPLSVSDRRGGDSDGVEPEAGAPAGVHGIPVVVDGQSGAKKNGDGAGAMSATSDVIAAGSMSTTSMSHSASPA